MEEQQTGAPAPLFEVGQSVLVDEGPSGPCTIDSIEKGMIPAINPTDPADENFTVEGYWYTVQPESGGSPYRAPEFNLTACETPQEPRESDETVISDPPTVFEDLGRAYEQATEDRRETFPILAGRFKGRLAMIARPVDAAKRKKKVRRLAKRGITDESEAQYAATVIAEACECIVVRVKDGEEYVPAHTLSDELGADPVRFDQRLGLVVPPLGKLLTGNEQPATIVRLLFRNMDALDAFYTELDLWLKEAIVGEDDEEDQPDPS